MGHHATAAGNWMDGDPVKITAHRIPADPIRDRWPTEVLDSSMHVVHNFVPIPGLGKDSVAADRQLRRRQPARSPEAIGKWQLHASRRRQPGQPEREPRLQRDQTGPAQERQEVHRHERAVARQPGRRLHVADDDRGTVAPTRHRRRAEVGPCRLGRGSGRRRQRRTRHRGPRRGRQGQPRRPRLPGDRRHRQQMVSADRRRTAASRRSRISPASPILDGDGKIDIVAVGRQSHNARIYWNKGR